MLFPEFVEMLSVLSDAGAEYVVIGGYAVGVHLEPRATKDLDVFIRPSQANARRVMRANRPADLYLKREFRRGLAIAST
jgi:hypothetical protein